MRRLHSPANLVRWQGYFDEMVKLVGDDQYRQLQLGRARINLDVMTLLTWENIQAAEPEFATRAMLDTVGRRYIAEVKADNEDTYRALNGGSGAGWELKNFLASGETAYRSLASGRNAPIPSELVEKYGRDHVRAIRLDGRTGVPKRLDEPDAANGIAVEVKIADAKIVHMPTVMVKKADGSFARERDSFIEFSENPFLRKNIPTYIAAKGYRPYLMGRTKLTAAETVVITGVECKVQFYIGAPFDPANPEQEFDVYVSIKHLEKDHVLIDRMYVCKVPGRRKARR